MRTCGWQGWHGEAGLRGGVHVGDPIELLLHRSDSCLASVEEMPERLVRLPVGMHDRTAHVIRVEAHLKQGFR